MSNNGADVNNRPSTDSCYFRVPNSYNSKILEKNGWKFTDEAQVKYISSHNLTTLTIVEEFLIYY